jgi:hypothetical protein
MRQVIRKIAKESKKRDFFWRYGFNFSPTVKYVAQNNDKLGSAEKSVLNDLNQNGIAISTVDKLLGENNLFQELDSAANDILESRRDEIAALKLRANDEDKIGNKTFNLELLESELTFDADSIFAKLAINNSLLNIANSYFQMYAKLRYYNVWKTFASHSSPRESQLWHFDREDRYILKIFLYLSDVDEGAGPFTYAPGTHKKGKFNNLEPEFFIEGVVQRTTDEQMNKVFPKEKWIKGTGRKGTIIFADTRGFHKGGEARTNDRLMFTCMFTSPASESKKLIKYPENLNLEKLSKKQLKAIYF